MKPEEIKKAIDFCNEEIKSLELAPEINGCEMKNEWQEQIDIYKTIISAFDLINQYEAEIKRLKWERDAYIEIENTSITEAKAEAYKECIEKVKEYIDTYEHLACEECECVPISKDGLDNLLKEKGVNE